jgi:1-deoxy-D-xylulose-5-phosphate synthase
MSSILAKIDSPSDLRRLSSRELAGLAAEIRAEMVRVVSLNGGHLASSLGTVELTIALHRVFDSPRDKIVWDVGHQSYAHKMLTGRRERFSTLRQYGGISGFPAPWESPHDAFVAGHSGNSISAALGMSLASQLQGIDNRIVAVIGDGSLGAGMAFEAINHAGHLGNRLIVVLNDNGMSISPSVGALSRLLSQVKLDSRYTQAKRKMRSALKYLPFGDSAWSLSKRMKRSVERVILPNAFWEQMGFAYLGPLDGHNIKEMEAALSRSRDMEARPILIHVITQKGKGHPEAESDVVRYHGLSPSSNAAPASPSFSQVFGQTVAELVALDSRVVVISAAMLEGTGLSGVAAQFPGRVFDVGICEQHAVTLAAGLASQGLIPIVAIYSTFLQRAYDQIVHDLCLPNLPVILAVDRAGIVGEDGKTHQGLFDVAFLRCLPNILLASPADENELRNLLFSSLNYRRPVAIRYPRGRSRGARTGPGFQNLPFGKAELLRAGGDLTIAALGPPAYSALQAANALSAEGLECAVINARYAKPLDSAMILEQVAVSGNLLTLEEGTLCGGFGSAVLELLANHDMRQVKVKSLGIADSFVEHGPQELFRSLANLDSQGIVETVQTDFAELSRRPARRIKEEA